MNKIKNKEALSLLSQILTDFGNKVIKQEASEEGFYCDFKVDKTISANDFPFILDRLPRYSVLTSVSGLQLDFPAQRIHGRCFENEKELQAFTKLEEELLELDHRHLGTMLELFKIDSDISPGMVTWLPKGAIVLEKIKKLIRDIMKLNGYHEVVTPQLADLDLWKKSGHWDMYRDHMFTVKGGEDGLTYALKPMSCPLHIEIFKGFHLSYKDLPYKLSEFGCCTRYEHSGALHGLFRVRAFTQDDAHVFCTEDQITSTIVEFIKILQKIYSAFDFECKKVCLATRPDNFAGTIENWGKAERSLQEAARKAEIELEINAGDGAFYGPKLEFYLEDNRKRLWQCGTVQLDFVLANRLQATYVTSENTKAVPVMIHHAILGTIERFFGILLENTKGQLPLWLAPLQVVILPIHSDHLEYCKSIQEELSDFTCEIDLSQDTLSYRIRKWWSRNKVPIILVIGEKEKRNGSVSVRIYGKEDSKGLTREEFMNTIRRMGKIFE